MKAGGLAEGRKGQSGTEGQKTRRSNQLDKLNWACTTDTIVILIMIIYQSIILINAVL